MYKINKILLSRLILLLNIALVLIIFNYSFGFDKVIPSNIAWITNGDRAQHYLGWQVYRYNPWILPHIGMTKIFNNYQPVSIMYFDCIPLLAIFFKIFNPLLPNNFQYLGIFILSSFVLNYLFGYLLLAHVTKQKILSSILAWLFFLTPIWFWRTGGHEALSAHWLIVWGLYLFIYNHKKENISQQNPSVYMSFSLLLLISFFIHSYFTMMIIIIYSVLLLKKIIVTRQIVKTGIYAAVSLLPLFLGTYLLGALNGFRFKKDLIQVVFGFSLNSNLNTWINPLTFNNNNTTFIPEMPVLFGQYEGAAYLGLGILTSLFFIVIYYAVNLFKSKNILNTFMDFIRKNMYYILLILIFTTFSTGLQFTFNQHIILNLQSLMPGRIMRSLYLFRAFGRFIWPANYLIISFVSICLIRSFSIFKYKKTIIVLCFFIIVIQAIDINNIYFGLSSYKISYIRDTKSRDQEQALFNQYALGAHNLILVGPAVNTPNEHIEVAWWGIHNNMHLNTMYLARIPNRVAKNALYDDKNFRAGIIKNDNLYITNDLDVIKEFKSNTKEKFEIDKFNKYWLVKKIS